MKDVFKETSVVKDDIPFDYLEKMAPDAHKTLSEFDKKNQKTGT